MCGRVDGHAMVHGAELYLCFLRPCASPQEGAVMLHIVNQDRTFSIITDKVASLEMHSPGSQWVETQANSQPAWTNHTSGSSLLAVSVALLTLEITKNQRVATAYGGRIHSSRLGKHSEKNLAASPATQGSVVVLISHHTSVDLFSRTVLIPNIPNPCP